MLDRILETAGDAIHNALMAGGIISFITWVAVLAALATGNL